MPDLMANQPIGSFSWTTTFSTGATVGTRFQVSQAGLFTRAGFYRAGTGTAIHRLAIYNSAGAKLWEDTSITDSGTTGWQYTDVSPPLACSTGITYTVAGGYQQDEGRAFNLTPSSRVSPPTPFIYDDTPAYHAAALDTYPNSSLTDRYYGLSLTWNEPSDPNPGPGEGDPALTGDLNAWLSADPAIQTHETDGLPWLTKLATDALLIGQAAGAIVWNATQEIVELIPKRGDSEWSNVLKLWQIAGVLTDAEIALWNLFAKRAPSQLTGPTPGGGSAFFGPSGGQVAERAEVAATNGELVWHRMQTAHWLDAVPGGDWLLQDTLTWAGPIGWNQPADCYVITITDWPPTWDEQDVDGHLWLPRAAWWSPLSDTIPHERKFVDFQQQILEVLPRRCSGILLCPRENFAGTIQAWLRPTPPTS